MEIDHKTKQEIDKVLRILKDAWTNASSNGDYAMIRIQDAINILKKIS